MISAECTARFLQAVLHFPSVSCCFYHLLHYLLTDAIFPYFQHLQISYLYVTSFLQAILQISYLLFCRLQCCSALYYIEFWNYSGIHSVDEYLLLLECFSTYILRAHCFWWIHFIASDTLLEEPSQIHVIG
jgi:hypothetical protein